MNVQGETLENQISYWKEELAGAPTKLELPADKPRPAMQSFRGATEIFELPKELREKLKSIGLQEQATLFMTLVAAFMALLHRYTGQDDILVGTPIEIESLIGCVRNTVVLRSLFTDGLSFRTLLQQVRERAEGAYAHSDLPFEQIVDELVTERDPSHSPIFQVMFAFHDAEGASKASSSRALETGTLKFDLTLTISETENGLDGLAEYNTDLFEAAMIKRLCGHYGMLLEAIARDPDRSISTLPMLSERERTQILYEWNDTCAEYPKACVHELFEQQVARHPDAIALVFEGQQLSFQEVNQRANQVAHYLRKRGVGPEVLVGVCLKRCPEMLVALLGIWKAGGAYVPLDPAYPKERLSFMLGDAAAKFLLTDSKHKGLFLSAKDKTICVDSDWLVIGKESTSNLDSAAGPSNLAYVMYTSGSTGEPKGVMVLHGGLTNYLCWAIKTYSPEEGDPAPVHTSISFDLTVTSLYTPLVAGGPVEILPEDVGGQNLVAALRQGKERSLVKITPAHLALLSQQLRPEEAACRTKLFVIGGENLLAESLHLWRESAPATRLINEYGPTETVVGCCVYEVRADDPRSGSVPIGRPIANTQLYILDRYVNPVPPGVVGELYIGGAGVARGYLNRPELTQEKFIADPFSGLSGARLYKTGDLARYRPDGTLEYLARVDNQVKVRGYRIELGEIEATLADHPGVKSCAVLAREDTPGDKQLVGYVISRGNELPTVESLRQFLKEKLPEYMVPAQFVFLDSMPLTLNGKIDKKALPAPSHKNVSDARTFMAPRTDIEKALAAIYAELLKVERIGIHDDFFDLGGHSLMAIKAVSKIREAFGVDLPLATLLEAPTIADLSKILRKEDWVPSWASLVPMRQGGSKPPLYLMHAHGGNVLEYHPLVNELEPDLPVYAFQAKGLDGHFTKDPSVEELASDYIKELRSFQPQGPYYLGGFCLGGLLALEAAQQLTAAGQEVALVVMIQSMPPEARLFKPGTTVFQRWWYRATTRIKLEMENLSHRGKGYLAERGRRVWDVGRTRIAIAFDKWTGGKHTDPSQRPMLYVFEALGIELKKALEKYVPRAYGGDVLLFRASRQLTGLASDEYLGWKRVLHGNLDVCEIPGRQQNLLVEPSVSQLSKELSSRLKAAQQRYSDEARKQPARTTTRGVLLPT
ncbi:MAG: amino acid adenylation domain-containing protein [Candidatus Acidiferrum sp.]